jgi:hypothetical protein
MAYHKDEVQRHPYVDYHGRRIGDIRVVSIVGRDKWGCLVWLCKCLRLGCGQYFRATAGALCKRIKRNGKSCGCWHRLRVKQSNKERWMNNG